MNATRPYWWLVNIGSGNGLVPSGNKPLPEPMLTQINVAKCSGINVLNDCFCEFPNYMYVVLYTMNMLYLTMW